MVMRQMRYPVAFALLFVALAPAVPANAEDDRRSPRWAIRFEPGVVISGGHMTDSGLVGKPPPVYIGASLDRAITGPLRASVGGGASLQLGWLIGGTLRYAAYDTEAIALSIGAGPLFAPDASFGAGAFAQIDAVLQVRIASSVGLIVATGAAFALNNAGVRDCGVDTCRAWLERGDAFASARGGVGFAF